MLIAAPLVFLALLAVPTVAGAATQVSVQQVQGLDVVVATDDDSAGDIQTSLGIDSGQHFAAVQSAGGAAPGAGCQAVSATVVGCPGDFDAIVVFGNGGNDQITLRLIADGLPPLHGEASGGAGDDTLKAPPDNRAVPQPETYMEGGTGNDTLVSGNGADELHGGDGNDTIQSFAGADVVRGEAGDDSLSAGKEEPLTNAADVVDGGDGFDTIPNVDADYNRGSDDDVSVTLDGQANDGERDEGDNVIAVEKLSVTADHATIVGSDAADDIFVDANSSTISGLGGNDRLVAYDGSDTIAGGAGDDFLEGGFGNDVLDGGPGVDQFNGDRTERNVIAIGNDRILARDGVSEPVNCGIGADTAQVDASDVVDPSCESVDRPGPPPPNPAPTQTVLGKVSIKAKGLKLQISCPAACTVAAQLRVDKQAARRLALGRSRVLARATTTLRAGGTGTLTLKVVKKARKRFARLRRLKVTLKTTTTIAGQKPATTSRSLTLKRPLAAVAAAQEADLVVQTVKTSHRPAPAYLFLTDDRLEFSIKVKNNGPGATKAGGTLRVVDPMTGTAFHRLTFTTPRIRPGGVHVARVTVRSKYMIGIERYRTRACVASSRDHSTRNNCRNGPAFTVIPRTWTGKIEATSPFNPLEGSAVETSVAEVRFVFDNARDAGFFYKGGGPVTYSTAGSYGGCNYGGGSTLNINAAQTSLQLRPDLSAYYGTGAEVDEHYTITVECGILGPQPPQQGPKNVAWWTTPLKPWGQDKRTITDSNADLVGRLWKWNLSAG